MRRPAANRVLLSFMVLVFIPGAEGHALTLSQAVSEALTNANTSGFSAPNLLTTRISRFRIQQEARRAQAKYLPEIDLSMGRGQEWTSSPASRSVEGGVALDRGEVSLRLKQRLFDGFETRSELEKAEAELQANTYNSQWASESLALQVVKAYLDVLEQRQQMALGRENLALREKILKKRREMVAVGTGNQVEVKEAQSRFAQARADRQDALSRLAKAETLFFRLVGTPPGNLARPRMDDSFLPPTRERAVAMVLQRHPALFAARYDLEGIRAEAKTKRTAFWPKINLELSLANNENTGGSRGYTDNALAMVRLEHRLFQGGFHLADYCLSQKKVTAFRETLALTRQDVIKKVTDSWHEIQRTQGRLGQLEN